MVVVAGTRVLSRNIGGHQQLMTVALAINFHREESMLPTKEDPALLLFEALLGGHSGDAIERQERRGQDALVNSRALPVKFNSGTKEQLEGFGVVFGEPIDDLFCNATLPSGWKKKATGHSMWSKLIDEQGRERASIFYKAASYDRDAFINVSRRFSYCVEPVNGWEDKDCDKYQWHCVVTDCETIVWKSETIGPRPDYSDRGAYLKFFNEKQTLELVGKEWIEEHYPDYRNQSAYWAAE
jgi:hypothetical protein